MVWHDCLLTTNDEHLFTGEALALCGGKKKRWLAVSRAVFVGGSGMLPLGQSKQDVECRKATD